MADNYLERRMEELRSGKLAVKKAIPGIRKKARRIVVAGGCHGKALDKALQYRREGHRVAIFDKDEQTGKRLAHDHGIRFHRVDIEDESAMKKEMQSLLSAWRDVDTVVGTNDLTETLGIIARKWKENFPIPDKSDIDFVII
ncbi:MAG: hypothetical protein HDS27_01555 [Bacteroides sp.]|nr:hypothetical protein [Bacteroides sp.]